MIRSKAKIITTHAQRYLDRVYTHVRYRTEATLEGSHAVIFMDGVVIIGNARADALTLELTSSRVDTLERAQHDMKTFLEYWGENDALSVDWELVAS